MLLRFWILICKIMMKFTYSNVYTCVYYLCYDPYLKLEVIFNLSKSCLHFAMD